MLSCSGCPQLYGARDKLRVLAGKPIRFMVVPNPHLRVVLPHLPLDRLLLTPGRVMLGNRVALHSDDALQLFGVLRKHDCIGMLKGDLRVDQSRLEAKRSRR